MIPNTDDFSVDFVDYEVPTKTFKLNYETNRVQGFVDGVEAMKQTIFSILNTEKGNFDIYSNNYGVSLRDLIGRSRKEADIMIYERVSTALLNDDRITDITDFNIEKNGDTLTITFSVTTTVGEIDIESAVSF